MGAFCVFGISRVLCRATAARKVPVYDAKEKRHLSQEEWAARRDQLGDELFESVTRRVKISPEFDAPQFCDDWLKVDGPQVKSTVIMVRGPKRDKNGAEVKRDGVAVETWLEYSAECARLGIVGP